MCKKGGKTGIWLTSWAFSCACLKSTQACSSAFEGGVRLIKETAASQVDSINGQIKKQ